MSRWVEEGDLVVIEHDRSELIASGKLLIIGYDCNSSDVPITHGTQGIAYSFDGTNRAWWVFLSTGRKVLVNSRFVKVAARGS